MASVLCGEDSCVSCLHCQPQPFAPNLLTEKRRFEIPREYGKCILLTRNLTTVSLMRATSIPPSPKQSWCEEIFCQFTSEPLQHCFWGGGGGLNIDVPETVVKFLAGLAECKDDFGTVTACISSHCELCFASSLARETWSSLLLASAHSRGAGLSDKLNEVPLERTSERLA